MIPSTKSQSGDPAKKHLHPAHDGHGFPECTVQEDYVTPYAAVDATLDVQL